MHSKKYITFDLLRINSISLQFFLMFLMFFPVDWDSSWYEKFVGCFFVSGLQGLWLVWGSPLPLQTTGVCLLPPA